MRFLALILFTPAFAILAWLYWHFPLAMPRTTRRRAFDAVAIVVAAGATTIAVAYAMAQSGTAHGAMWPQILAVLGAFHTFPFTLAIAWLVRAYAFSDSVG